ncbi:MAG: sugar transferase [Firmicutes bacterium]|uniref:Sugar transferase n=1 Tax=Candidatus Stercoripulliclostridium pullicola TaxID=2840953 RepID=A0A940DH74_9FIRM|nr:sugar transferase [Candidatus Stercoripulliclostridium pullicola]
MYKYIKSALDRVCAALGLIVLAIPLLLIALAIRCESRGKAIFKQVRTGLNGKEFYVYKFRTMWRTDVPFDKDNPVIEDDNAELTPAGKILRKLKIDEFPQLINVLRGEMSLIGPRPFMPVYYEQYANWEKERLSVKPGMSGLAQVSGNGYLTSEERSYYDIYYARHLSFFTDVKIMFKTVGVLLLGEKKFLKPVSVADMEKMKGGESADKAA